MSIGGVRAGGRSSRSAEWRGEGGIVGGYDGCATPCRGTSGRPRSPGGRRAGPGRRLRTRPGSGGCRCSCSPSCSSRRRSRVRRAGRPPSGADRSTPSTSTSPLSQCRPTTVTVSGSGPVEAADDAGLEPLVEQRDLEVVAHPAVDGDERDRAALDRGDPVDRRRRDGHHAAAGLDDDLGLRRQVLAGRADQRVEVGADRRRLVGPGVAGTQPAAEVVDRELAERGDRRHRVRERLARRGSASRRARAAPASAAAGCARCA